MAWSSAESKIHAPDEYTRTIQHMFEFVDCMGLKDNIMQSPTLIYNNNSACVCWAHSPTTKILRHIQIRENAVREAVQDKQVKIKHIACKFNLADMFTKENKDISHFLQLQDMLLEIPPEVIDPKGNDAHSPTHPPIKPTLPPVPEQGQNEGVLVCLYVLLTHRPAIDTI
eukprot:7190833-Ditylum_brightwellii.AAC.2